MKPEALAVKFFTLPDFSNFFNPSDYPNSPPPRWLFHFEKNFSSPAPPDTSGTRVLIFEFEIIFEYYSGTIL